MHDYAFSYLLCVYIYDLNHNRRNDETMATHGKQKATTAPGTIKSRLHQFIQSAQAQLQPGDTELETVLGP